MMILSGVFGLLAAIRYVAMIEYYVRIGTPEETVDAAKFYQPAKDPGNVTWLPPSQEALALTEADRIQIAASMGKAYESLYKAQKQVEFPVLSNFFTKLTYNKMKRAYQKQSQDRVYKIPLWRQIYPYFFPEDGNIFVAESKSDQFLEVYQEKGKSLRFTLLSEDHRLAMVKKDGRWQFHYDDPTISRKSKLSSREPWSPENPLKGINYYPRLTPWEKFWPNFERKTIARDLKRMRDVGANSIRIFVPGTGFHTRPKNLKNLRTFISMAKKIRVKVIVTLWDQIDYSLENWPFLLANLREISLTLRDYKNDIIIDIKNEPDLDFAYYGKAQVLSLLKAGLLLIDEAAPDLPVTIGWADPRQAHHLSDYLSIVSFHYYGTPEKFKTSVGELSRKVEPKPLLLSEFGLPTWNSFFFPHGHSEQEQADYLSSILNQSRRIGLSGYLVWTLYDFPELPSWLENASILPWKTEAQKTMGLFSEKGVPKLSVSVFKDPKSYWPVKNYLSNEFLKPFRITVATLAFLIFLVVWRRIVVYRNDRDVNKDHYQP